MKKKNRIADEDIRPEYDFASMKGGVHGRYMKRIRAGTNLVLLEPDITTAFPTDDAVYEALRGLLEKENALRQKRRVDRKISGAAAPHGINDKNSSDFYFFFFIKASRPAKGL
jgi:hypothetical protein